MPLEAVPGCGKCAMSDDIIWPEGAMEETVELEVEEVEWNMLLPHAKRGALYLLSIGEDLMSVAEAMRDDDVSKIKPLIEGQRLVAPTEAQLDGPIDALFRFVIVQPYVIGQGPLNS